MSVAPATGNLSIEYLIQNDEKNNAGCVQQIINNSKYTGKNETMATIM